MTDSAYVDEVLAALEHRDHGEPEFLQAVREVLEDLGPVIEAHPSYRDQALLERLVEPERVVRFRVPWVDDAGAVQVERAWRVQFNSALGPYKGGLRFHPSVNASILKFLGFEQTFKNALTGLPLGGGKGGSDFDPKGRSDGEIMRFCQALMTELVRHIGPETDVPAGDIGVGGREVGYLFGQYKRLVNRWDGVLTGKPPALGGSYKREEATGYGAVFFAGEMLAATGRDLADQRVLISGAGNVAVFAAEKLIEVGATPLTLSDTSGFVLAEDGLTHEHLAFVKELKFQRRGRLHELAEAFPDTIRYTGRRRTEPDPLWAVPADGAFPCATQNEVDETEAATFLEGGGRFVVEGANMPLTAEAAHRLHDAGVLHAPGKASNAGGVATSGLEMAQNAGHTRWSGERVESELKAIMRHIHTRVREAASQWSHPDDLHAGANIAGFLRVADAMIRQGVV